ncbi:MAG: hypothetical protein HYV78_01665 [Candidatus Wildermuthbacteria bacterium]|nr:hypothetical protein [Candidatus Wildermuthbacteria bacterium]
MNSSFALGLSTLLGTIIGAGIFALPYVVSKSGAASGIFYLLFLGAVMALLHLCFGEICLRTAEKHRLIGYAQKYIGFSGKVLVTISTLAGTIGALLAYIILGGAFLEMLLSRVLPLSGYAFSLLFWGALSFFVFQSIRAVAKAELVMNAVLFAAVVLLLAFTLPKADISNFSLFNANYLFLPFGVMLFSLSGGSAIPEIAELLKSGRDKKSLFKLIALGFGIVVALYALFTFGVVGVSGENTTKDALEGLRASLGDGVVAVGALFGLLAVATSYLILGDYLKNSFVRDYRYPPLVSGIVAVGIPLALFAYGFQEFISVIGVAGTVMGVLEGATILWIFRNAKTMGDREPEYSLRIPSALLAAIFLVLVGGAIAEFLF